MWQCDVAQTFQSVGLGIIDRRSVLTAKGREYTRRSGRNREHLQARDRRGTDMADCRPSASKPACGIGNHGQDAHATATEFLTQRREGRRLPKNAAQCGSTQVVVTARSWPRSEAEWVTQAGARWADEEQGSARSSRGDEAGDRDAPNLTADTRGIGNHGQDAHTTRRTTEFLLRLGGGVIGVEWVQLHRALMGYHDQIHVFHRYCT